MLLSRRLCELELVLQLARLADACGVRPPSGYHAWPVLLSQGVHLRSAATVRKLLGGSGVWGQHELRDMGRIIGATWPVQTKPRLGLYGARS